MTVLFAYLLTISFRLEATARRKPVLAGLDVGVESPWSVVSAEESASSIWVVVVSSV